MVKTEPEIVKTDPAETEEALTKKMVKTEPVETDEALNSSMVEVESVKTEGALTTSIVKTEPVETDEALSNSVVKVEPVKMEEALTTSIVTTEPAEKVERETMSSEVQKLLMNKFVVILGDSNQRCVYKDLVALLQGDEIMNDKETRAKGEMTFRNDALVEGGVRGKLTNCTGYVEEREYVTANHLVKFYFVTRCYNNYIESILQQMSTDHAPDLLIMNSCLWDLTRYAPGPLIQYKQKMEMLCGRLLKLLGPETMVVWTTALPVDKRARGGFLGPNAEYKSRRLTHDVFIANFEARSIVVDHGFSVLDLHYWFRDRLELRARDGVHWCGTAHRFMSVLLLTSVAHLWDIPFQPVHCLNSRTPAKPKELTLSELSSLADLVFLMSENVQRMSEFRHSLQNEEAEQKGIPFRRTRPAPYHLPVVNMAFSGVTNGGRRPWHADFNRNIRRENRLRKMPKYNGPSNFSPCNRSFSCGPDNGPLSFSPWWSDGFDGPFMNLNDSGAFFIEDSGPIWPDHWSTDPGNFAGFVMPQNPVPPDFFNGWSDYMQDNFMGAQRRQYPTKYARYRTY